MTLIAMNCFKRFGASCSRGCFEGGLLVDKKSNCLVSPLLAMMKGTFQAIAFAVVGLL